VAGESAGSLRVQQKRGAGTSNPIKLAKLKIRLVYPPYRKDSISERPARNMEYGLRIDAKKPYELKGKTDGQGILEREVPATAKSGTLTLYVTAKGKKTVFWTIRLEIGGLAAPDTVWGQKARLNNLGLFASRELSEETDAQFRRAQLRFRTLFGPPSAFPNPAKLEEVYGS
jgi:hypothetical protein